MKLSQWAKQNGLSYRTAWRLFKNNQLPVAASQLKTGTILVSDKLKTTSSKAVSIYARVSSQDQKKDLERQIVRLCDFAISRGFVVNSMVKEIGSGMNSHRAKLLRLLKDDKVSCILVEHRDRLSRFGFEYLEAVMQSSGRSILVCDHKEISGDKNDLVRDMIEVMTSFCARLYGRRSAANRAKRAMKIMKETKRSK